MASFPANVCGGGCKRLQEWLQTFAGTVAMLCVREGQSWHRNRQSYSVEEKRGRKVHYMGHCSPPKEFAQPFLRGPMYDI